MSAKELSPAQQRLADLLAEFPLFEKLGRKQESLLRFGRFDMFEPGATITSQGEYTGEFCVVLKGMVSAYRVDDRGQTSRLGTLSAGSWFGEMSALSNQPAMATVVAESPTQLLVIDPPLFAELYKGKGAFPKLIDEQYRERALALHLRVAPLFKGLSEEDLQAVQECAELVVFEADKVIAKQGDEADAIYLVRSGAVKCVRESSGGSARILGYFMDNSSFGERALSRDKGWPGSFTTMARTDVVRLPRDAVVDVFASKEETLDQLRATADLIVAEEAGEATGLYGIDRERYSDEFEIIVAKQSIKGGRALVIDLSKCTRCNACVESCVAVHDDRVPRLSKTGNRISSNFVLSSACYSCDIPDCMTACQDGAIRRDVMGQVRFVLENCTGCTACTLKCPYDVIRMFHPEQAPPTRGSLLGGLPFIGRFFSGTEVEQASAVDLGVSKRTERDAKAKAVKCDLCAGLPFEACVYNCPCGAISRVPPADLFQAEREEP